MATDFLADNYRNKGNIIGLTQALNAAGSMSETEATLVTGWKFMLYPASAYAANHAITNYGLEKGVAVFMATGEYNAAIVSNSLLTGITDENGNTVPESAKKFKILGANPVRALGTEPIRVALILAEMKSTL